MTAQKLAFVAYPSRDTQLLSILRESLSKANGKSPVVRYEPWEFNDISGELLNSAEV